MTVRKYKEDIDYENLLLLFKSVKDWSWFLEKEIIPRHKKSLQESITYVALVNNQIVGYSRSLEDIGSYIYVCELLVAEESRGRALGRTLLERLVLDYPGHEVLVMSDEDPYYRKLGYQVEGSIFKVSLRGRG